jgi:hypothetical protein
MFRKSSTSHQLDIFSSNLSFFKGRSLKVYENEQSWHNQFFLQVTKRIDEEIFRVLFCEDFGAPNSPVRVLVGMMILKEGQGLSDAQLFENVRYNILYRCSLGLLNMNDATPAESTYYLLRKHIVEWEKSTGENLLDKVFSQITKSQALEFQVHGKKIRMDSKLISSNISFYSRYELIHETLRKAYIKVVRKSLSNLSLSESDIAFLERISEETGNKVSYRSSKAEISSQLKQTGLIINKILFQMGDHPSQIMQTLTCVFSEQYRTDESVVILRDKEEVSAASVQSPHDTDCHFRKKDEQKVKGYSINITETCDEARSCEVAATDTEDKASATDRAPSLNLITSVLVDVATTADSDFLQTAIESTREVVTGTIETVNADGAYHSVDNQEYCRNQQTPVDLVLGAIQGKVSQYDLSLDGDNQLVVTDMETNTILPVRQVKTRKKDAVSKWAIRNEKGQLRYFTQKEIDTSLLRKLIGNRTQDELNVRNNVEATIFQLGYHYSNAKSRYRGLIKHKMWANVRCLWINFVRISNFAVAELSRSIAGGGSKCVQNVKNRLILPHFLLNLVKMRCVIVPVKTFSSRWSEKRVWDDFKKIDFL